MKLKNTYKAHTYIQYCKIIKNSKDLKTVKLFEAHNALMFLLHDTFTQKINSIFFESQHTIIAHK